MKHILFTVLTFLSLTLLAQAPQGVGYQGVATDSEGIELINQSISIRASVLSGSANGTIEWEETHTTSTDTFGLFNLTIGQGINTGNSLQVNFADISWGTNTHFLKIEMDATGGNDFSFMGTNQMMSVPYALYAESANIDYDSISNYFSVNPNNTLSTSLGSYSIEISSESENTMNFSNAMLYCDSLSENTNQDWVLPTIDEMTFIGSGGIDFPDEKTEEYLWTRSNIFAGSSSIYVYDFTFINTNTQGLSSINSSVTNYSSLNKTRCVRREPIVNSNSNDESYTILNSQQSISMIGPMYRYDEFPEFEHQYSANQNTFISTIWDAIKFCGQLDYDGYDDWFLPSLNQLKNFYLNNSEILIPNRLDEGNQNFFINETNDPLQNFGIVLSGPNVTYSNKLIYVEPFPDRCFCTR